MKKKILIITLWLDWWWAWKIAALLENLLNSYYETVTLVLFHDLWIFPIKWKKINIWAFWKKEFPWRGYIALIPHIINTIRYIKKEKPNIVIWAWTYGNFLWLIAKRFSNYKLLLTQHEHITSYSSCIPVFALFNLMFFVIKRLIWDTKIVCVSDEVRLDTIKQYWIKETQAQTIYNWLNFVEIKKLWNEKINIHDKYIINIWRLDDWKNQELLIKAYSKSKIKEKYKLLLLWKWYKEEYLKNLCKELNIENYVIFAWFDKNPYKYLSKASLFCFTSKSEALPTVLIESLILDIPIITVPVIWSSEILNNGEFWVITKDWDEWNLVKELDNFIEWWNINLNHEKLKNFINENFSIEAMERKYLETIDNL